jgi:hypothetical protein
MKGLKRKKYSLDEAKVKKLRRLLKTSSDTEAVHKAVDLVLFQNARLTGSPYPPAPARWVESPYDFRFWIFDFRLLDHRITLSALASTLGGIVRPICFAAFRLMMNSNFFGCSTGMSAGLVPFRILSTIDAARLKDSAWSGP